VDPVTLISSALTSIKTATEIAKFLRDTDISLEKAEFKLKVADLVNSLADAKLQIADIKNIVTEKDQFIKDLSEKLKIKGQVSYEAPFYWLSDEGKKDGPFCQKCYDTDQKLIRLQGQDNDIWHCFTCKNYFYGPNYRPYDPPTTQRPYGPWGM
jgi:hypothetical protein